MSNPFHDYPTMCLTGTISRLLEDGKYGDMTPDKIQRLKQARAELDQRIDVVLIEPNYSGQKRDGT